MGLLAETVILLDKNYFCNNNLLEFIIISPWLCPFNILHADITSWSFYCQKIIPVGLIFGMLLV